MSENLFSQAPEPPPSISDPAADQTPPGSQLPNLVALRGFAQMPPALVFRGYFAAKGSSRVSEALLLAYLAQIDARKLYREQGFSSTFAFCAAELDATEDMILRRIHAARVAREFPEVLPMLADGRVHLFAISMLKRFLSHANAAELLAAVANKSKSEIERVLAERFPSSDLLPWTQGPVEVEQLTVGAATRAMTDEDGRPTPAPSEPPMTSPEQNRATMVVPERVDSTPPSNVRVRPVARGAYGVQFMMEQEARDDLEYLRAVLGHEAPSDALVFARALKALIREVEKSKFAATSRPRQAHAQEGRASANPRHVPAHVIREVARRDQGRCTFVSASGRRCEARHSLELDHVLPVALGGESTVDNLRLLCRAHNQLEAERRFGAEFMARKREAARRARAAGRNATQACGEAGEKQTPPG